VNHTEIVSFLWGVADLIRDDFKRGKYQDVILPLTVLRRLDCVLEPTKKSRSSPPRRSTAESSRTRTASSGAPPASPSTTRPSTTSRATALITAAVTGQLEVPMS
jgi:type I restriction-modification system DNA methylase subunit